MAIRRFRQDLDRNFGLMIDVESKIKRLNLRASDDSFDKATENSVASWKSKLLNINDSIETIKRILADGKRRVEGVWFGCEKNSKAEERKGSRETTFNST